MECPICRDPSRRTWVCIPCVNHGLHRRRLLASKIETKVSVLESDFLQASRSRRERAGKQAERERRRMKMKKVQEEIEREQREVKCLQSKMNKLQTAHSEQTSRLETARNMLASYISDFNVTPEELKQLQSQLLTSPSQATNPIPLGPSSAAPSSSTAPSPASKRRLQVNPLFTHNLSKYLSQLNSKLARYRLRLIEQLLQLYIIKRKSSHSCSIIGLELMDDPDAMFAAAHSPAAVPPTGAPSTATTEGESPAGFQGPPGTDPEVIAAALGYIVFVLHMLSCYLSIRLPYAIRFHGSHSYVIFNDDTSTRYFLTLLDNTNENHFRRAITLLSHNIQYFVEKMSASVGHARAAKSNNNSSMDLTTPNLPPLHLLPNMLILIQTIFLHLKQQNSDPYTDHEQRVQHGLSAAHKVHHPNHLVLQSSPSQQLPLQINQLSTTTNSSTSSSSAPPPVMNPFLSRQDTPPFYTDQKQKVASMNMNSYGPLDSPQRQQSGGGGLSMTPLTRGTSTPSNYRQQLFASPSSSQLQSPHLQLQHSDLLQPSQFFDLPTTNGYFATEEPRESMILPHPPATGGMRQVYGSPMNTRLGMVGGGISITPITRGSSFGSPTQPQQLHPSSSNRSLAAASPSSVSSLTPSHTPTHLQRTSSSTSTSSTGTHQLQQSNRSIGYSPYPSSGTSNSYSSNLASYPPSSNRPTATNAGAPLPVVSYSSEAEVDWDLIDVVTDETDTHDQQTMQQLTHQTRVMNQPHGTYQSHR